MSRRGAALLSGVSAFVFFTLAWHGTVTGTWAGDIGLGAWMGLIVLGTQLFATRPRSRNRAAARGGAASPGRP